MGFSVQLPVPGQPFATEGVKVGNDISAIAAWGNGHILGSDLDPAAGIAGGQLGTALAQSAAVNQASQTVKGAVSIPGTESTTSTTAALMPTPDQVTGIALAANGLIAVWYQAQWAVAGAASGNAGLYLNANPVQVAGPSNSFTNAGAALAGSVNMGHLATGAAGLFSEANISTASTDVTTGQVVGQGGGGGGAGQNVAAAYGPCYIFAAAGIYTVSVRFNTSSGAVPVSARNRQLWVHALSFA